MAYLGRAVDSGAISNIQNLDNISFNGSSSYSLTKNSVAFVPASASNLLISIDGVVNATNFTVSGSTIDFGVAVSSSSVCNFIIHLGVGIVTAPSDGSVGTSQLATNSISTIKIQDDAVTKDKLSAHNYPMFQAHLSSNQSLSNNVGTKVTLDVVDFDTASCWDATNYRWTPNVAGKYLIYRNIVLDNSAGVYFMESHIFKNGTHITTGRNTSVIENASNTDQTFESLAQSGICIVDMNGSSDYLELFGYIYNNGTGSIRGDRRSLMGAYRIGD